MPYFAPGKSFKETLGARVLYGDVCIVEGIREMYIRKSSRLELERQAKMLGR